MSAKLFLFECRPQRVSSVADFVNCVTAWKKEINLQAWFRGQSVIREKNLLPTAGREHIYGGKHVEGFDVDQERKLLNRFRRRSYTHLNRVLTEWEALFLARHHGLPTRILDWSANALVALWFACSANTKDRGFVWAIARVREEKNDLRILELLSEIQSFQLPGSSRSRSRGRHRRCG